MPFRVEVGYSDPPHATITVFNQPPGSQITVERTVDGETWVPVRGAHPVAMPNSRFLVVQDWACPLDVDVWYRVRRGDVVIAGVSQHNIWPELDPVGGFPNANGDIVPGFPTDAGGAVNQIMVPVRPGLRWLFDYQTTNMTALTITPTQTMIAWYTADHNHIHNNTINGDSPLLPGGIGGQTVTIGTASVNDFIAPANAAYFRLRPRFIAHWVDGAWRPLQTARVVLAQFVGNPQQVIIKVPSGGETWLQDAFTPRDGLQIRVDDFGPVWGSEAMRSASWPQPFDEVQVMGASLPVESVGVRSKVGEIPIQMHALIPVQADRLRQLLFDAGLLLIRGAPCEFLAPSAFIAFPNVEEVHYGNPHEVATFYGTARRCQEPSLEIRIAFWTWDQVQALVRNAHGNLTFAQMQALTGGLTYSHVHRNPTLLAQ